MGPTWTLMTSQRKSLRAEATFTVATALFFQHSLFCKTLIVAILGQLGDLSTSKIPILGKSISLEKHMNLSLLCFCHSLRALAVKPNKSISRDMAVSLLLLCPKCPLGETPLRVKPPIPSRGSWGRNPRVKPKNSMGRNMVVSLLLLCPKCPPGETPLPWGGYPKFRLSFFH